MIAFLLKGMILGLSAGFSPGPLTMLVLSETLNHNSRAGIKVGMAPLITDAPIVLLCYYVLAKFQNVNLLLGSLSLIGALYIAYLGIENFRIKPVTVETKNIKPRSLSKGIMVNFLSPNPYVYWLTVGAPFMISAKQNSIWHLILYLVGFYVCLLGAKATIAIVAGKSKTFISGNIYLWINRVLGMLLILFAGIVFMEGLDLLYTF